MQGKKVALGFLFAVSMLGTNSYGVTQGVVAGRVEFWNHNGHFCPEGRMPCTDAYYTHTDSENWVGFPRVTVQVQDPNHNVLGSSAADEEGNFVISWYSPAGATSYHLQWEAADYENRIELQYPSGTTVWWGTTNIPLQNGTTPASPQWRYPRSGSLTDPNANANMYWAAWMMWRWSLFFSSRMYSYFTNVRITTGSDECETSCADGYAMHIWMDTDPRTPFSPLYRVMHEMGHIASFLASGSSPGFKTAAIYDYNGNSGWSLQSAEWGADQFEEGYATFLAVGGFYGGNSPDPHICQLVNGTACLDNVYDIEYHWQPCDYANGENRWPLAALRYLWDVYDHPYSPDEEYSVPWSQMFTTMAQYGSGLSNHQENEPWCEPLWCFESSCWEICDEDGRGVGDFRYSHEVMTGGDTYDLWSGNCEPPGAN